MNEAKLKRINAITNSFHDLVASINEEFVDGNNGKVDEHVESLIKELKDFKSNIKNDEI